MVEGLSKLGRRETLRERIALYVAGAVALAAGGCVDMDNPDQDASEYANSGIEKSQDTFNLAEATEYKPHPDSIVESLWIHKKGIKIKLSPLTSSMVTVEVNNEESHELLVTGGGDGEIIEFDDSHPGAILRITLEGEQIIVDIPQKKDLPDSSTYYAMTP